MRLATVQLELLSLLMTVAIAGVGCVHTQAPERKIYVISEDSVGIGGSGTYDCDAEFKQCMKRCWDNRYPWPHNKKQGAWYYERCEQDCNREYNECEKEKEKEEAERRNKLTFSRMDEAIDWPRNHKAEVALGTVVVVAGVAFIITTGGSGALILAPLAL
ncbi:hypothetical protein F0U60_14315 [Archangium minus]|uniref:Lipoprotein n=1 Tax=Archangium minus TaxID=83450 RepID=A0ABY9WRR7_9BACT|nr:hypothetical protein F0U60_14315 [Archangium minus]